MAESERISIIDKDGENKMADVVPSVSTPGVNGIVILKSDGSNI